MVLAPALDQLRLERAGGFNAAENDKTLPIQVLQTSHEIIRLAVMLYVRFPLSLRNVEDLLHERGIEISHETALSDKTSLRQPMLFSGLKTKFNRLTVEYID